MDDSAVMIIQSYINEKLSDENLEPETWGFTKMSYSKWAAYEILEMVMDEFYILPEHISGRASLDINEVIDYFKSLMFRCLSVNKNNPRRSIFTTALKTADEIRNLFNRKETK